MVLSRILFIFCVSILSVLPLARAEDEIRIGVVTDLSGPAAYLGEQTRLGVLVAESELKQSGANVKIIIEDSGLDTKKAISAAQKLLFADKVDAFYIHLTPVVLATSPFLTSNKVLSVNAAGVDSFLRANPYSFKTLVDHRKGCVALASEFKRRGIKKLGLLKINTEYGERCFEGVSSVYSNPLVYDFNPGETVSIQVAQLKSKGAEAIINCAFEPDLLNMLKSMEELHYKVAVGDIHDAFTKKVFDRYAALLEGSLSYGLKPFPATLKAKAVSLNAGKESASYESSGAAWVHIHQLYRAVKECREKGIDCELETLSKANSVPEVGFLGWQDREADMETQLLEVKAGAFSPFALP